MENPFIEEFIGFLKKDLQPATKELERISEDKSRKHLQKLVYTNLVDRFDYCIDKTLIQHIETESLLNELLDKHKQPILEGEILKWMLSPVPLKEVALERLKETLRNTILRKRHSEKLCKLLIISGMTDNEFKRPRVNPATGKILDDFTPQDDKIPASVEGYADWLYCRRNAIVHGGGNVRIPENDLKQLRTKFKCDPATTGRIKLSSISNAANFYSVLISKMQG